MPYHTDDTPPEPMEDRDLIAHMLGQVLHIVYCNCTVTLIHNTVPCEAMPAAVPMEAMEEGGRCQECHALVRMGHVDQFTVVGPTIAYRMVSRTAEAIHAEE